MKKTVIIDGKAVGFESTAAFMIKYKKQFGKNALKEIAELANTIQKIKKKAKKENLDQETETLEMLEHLDMEVLYNLIWVFAYTADRSIPCLEDWLDSFEDFPLAEVLETVTELLTASFSSKKKF